MLVVLVVRCTIRHIFVRTTYTHTQTNIQEDRWKDIEMLEHVQCTKLCFYFTETMHLGIYLIPFRNSIQLNTAMQFWLVCMLVKFQMLGNDLKFGNVINIGVFYKAENVQFTKTKFTSFQVYFPNYDRSFTNIYFALSLLNNAFDNSRFAKQISLYCPQSQQITANVL